MITMADYDAIKAARPTCIVLARMGDFYEAFGADAATVAEVTGIALTHRRIGRKTRSIAGFSYASAHGYVRQLIQAGHTVALAEPKQGG